MSAQGKNLTTGLPGLDEVLKGILPGDNIVWQVDSIDNYLAFVKPYIEAARESGRRLIYFRFASHDPLVPEDFGADIHHLDPVDGFEAFIDKIHGVIEQAGRGAFYVFDCLSELAADWYSDQMLGNFFMLTCPYLYDLETVTYFALFRNHHSQRAIRPISETTQLLLEVYRHDEALYVHPLKVHLRYSPTMNMLHAWRSDETFETVTNSALISEILSSADWAGLYSDRRPGFWERTFLDAQETLSAVRHGECSDAEERELMTHLMRMIISRETDVLELLSKYFSLENVLNVRKRMIGTGLIGGKAVGMLVARNILKQSNENFAEFLEEHDSFFIGSDVFYTFLVRNGVWWIRGKQKHPDTFLEGAEQARQRILTGTFPDYIVDQFERMLDYFGQSPIIVRSSSLLEDNFGNSFAGKYDSVFCANQGPKERRLEDFLAAVRTVYASTMSENALTYRERRGLLELDEQMALLVMRVSGAMHGRKFYPHVAGVGFSFNPYAWNEHIDPEAGVVRLVYGLGTRAVDRSDDDYTRVVALNAPERRVESNFDEVRQYSQRRVDYIDLDANQLMSGDFSNLVDHAVDVPLQLFTSSETSGGSRASSSQLCLTFDRLLSETDFVARMRRALRLLTEAYGRPVDIEFTANFLDDERYRMNLVQCRPLQIKGAEISAIPKVEVEDKDCLLRARGAVIGQSRMADIDMIVYVVPELYGNLPLRDRYDVANLVGKINHSLGLHGPYKLMLLGPGRWGTSTPSLGIPVTFHQINKASVLCEIVTMREGLVPDVSLGTHFLNELVEMDMLYLALFPEQGDNNLNDTFFHGARNALLEVVPNAEKWEQMVKVVRVADLEPAGTRAVLHADAQAQEVLCFLTRP
jgi:pyruvate,water dikinase